jgi:hypothetical protein
MTTTLFSGSFTTWWRPKSRICPGVVQLVRPAHIFPTSPSWLGLKYMTLLAWQFTQKITAAMFLTLM